MKRVAPRGKERIFLVVSGGHHHRPSETLHAALLTKWGGTSDPSALSHRQTFLDAVGRLRPYLRPILQEAEPQHFPGGGGFKTTSTATPKPARLEQCEPLPPDAPSIGKLERELVWPYFSSVNGTILTTNSISADAWWAHTFAAPTPSGRSDCTHWCQPGIPDVWASKLLRQLLRSQYVAAS